MEQVREEIVDAEFSYALGIELGFIMQFFL